MRGGMTNDWLNKVAPAIIIAVIIAAFTMGFNHETRLAVAETLLGGVMKKLDQIDQKLDDIQDTLRRQP